MIKQTFKLILIFTVFSSGVNAKKTTVYNWLTLGKKSGEHIVSYNDDGSIRIDFEFNDRGRGPDTTEMITINSEGVMTNYKVTGKSYLGSLVDESFSLKNNLAKWSSDEESGSKELSSPTPYVAANATPGTQAILVQQILKSENNSLPLLPSGNGSVRKLKEIQIEASNQKKTVKLMALIGLGLTPSYIWLDDNNELFGVAYGWMGMTPKGWESTLELLQSTQDKADQVFHQSLSEKLTQKLPESVLIKNVNVLDVVKGKIKKHSAVLIEDGKIAVIGKKALKSKASKVIDGKNKTLMPGLWDMHTHISLSVFSAL